MATLNSETRPIIGRGPPLAARFIFLAALSVTLMVTDHRKGYLDKAREWSSVAIYPLQLAVETPFRLKDWLQSSFSTRADLRAENLRLQAELRVADLRLQRFAALAEENRQLRGIRESAGSITERTLVAEIMRVDLDPFRHRVLINKGASEGLYKGQAILDAHGIFGQITRVGRYTSEAILISDAAHAIPVQVNRNGLRSIAVGTGDLNKLSLPFLTGEADVKVDDLLISSGLGGIFPPGYPVARVSTVKRDPAETFAVVEAKPLAALDRDREILLIWYQEPPVDVPVPAAPAKPSGRAKRGAQ